MRGRHPRGGEPGAGAGRRIGTEHSQREGPGRVLQAERQSPRARAASRSQLSLPQRDREDTQRPPVPPAWGRIGRGATEAGLPAPAASPTPAQPSVPALTSHTSKPKANPEKDGSPGRRGLWRGCWQRPCLTRAPRPRPRSGPRGHLHCSLRGKVPSLPERRPDLRLGPAICDSAQSVPAGARAPRALPAWRDSILLSPQTAVRQARRPRSVSAQRHGPGLTDGGAHGNTAGGAPTSTRGPARAGRLGGAASRATPLPSGPRGWRRHLS